MTRQYLVPVHHRRVIAIQIWRDDMLKIVGTHKDGSIADERVLITDDDRPTRFLVGIALVELACDIALACLLAKTVFRK